MSVLANILFVSCLLFAGDNYQTHAQTKPPAGSKRTPPSQSGCNYNSETLRGVVKDFNPAYGGSVFPTLSYVFNVVCGNYADDWNVVNKSLTPLLPFTPANSPHRLTTGSFMHALIPACIIGSAHPETHLEPDELLSRSSNVRHQSFACPLFPFCGSHECQDLSVCRLCNGASGKPTCSITAHGFSRCCTLLSGRPSS